MNKSHKEPPAGNELETWTLENLKPLKSRKNKKERKKIGDTVEYECGDVQNDQNLLQCGMINTNCKRDDLF